MSVSLSLCSLPNCGYPVGECSGSCLAPRLPVPHGLPIDLVEPDEPAPVGDRAPCHLFMPEVSWPMPLPPVLRPIRRVYAGDFAWGTPLMPAMPPMPSDEPFKLPEPELMAPGFVNGAFILLAAAVVAALAAIYFNLPAFL